MKFRKQDRNFTITYRGMHVFFAVFAIKACVDFLKIFLIKIDFKNVK